VVNVIADKKPDLRRASRVSASIVRSAGEEMETVSTLAF